jgi:hypothetical protein
LQGGESRHRREVGDLRLGAVERLKGGQPREGRKVGDLRAEAAKRLQGGESRERCDVGNLRPGAAERLQGGQSREVREVGDPVLSACERLARIIRDPFPGPPPPQIQFPQMREPRNLRRNFLQSKPGQIQLSRALARLFRDALVGDRPTVEFSGHETPRAPRPIPSPSS